MNLKHITDTQLNLDLKHLVQNERELLTQILYHLKEIETRKLFSSYGCTSLFDYACKELKYSSDQAYRRIQAMRLLKEIPEAASKIDSGELTLSNISQAQKCFKETKTTHKLEKIKVLKKLMNKSVREGQKELLKLNPIPLSLPEETKKQITPTHTYVSFNMSQELEIKLDEIKSLLGPKIYKDGVMLTIEELIELIADLTKKQLMETKFGRKNVKINKSKALNTKVSSSDSTSSLSTTSSSSQTVYKEEQLQSLEADNKESQIKLSDSDNQENQIRMVETGQIRLIEIETNQIKTAETTDNKEDNSAMPSSCSFRENTLNVPSETQTVATILKNTKKESHLDQGAKSRNDQINLSLPNKQSTLDVQRRYVSKSIKYKLWQRSEGKCEKCKSQVNLNIDHIKPLALNGETVENNLRILCFNCNQRSRIVAGL